MSSPGYVTAAMSMKCRQETETTRIKTFQKTFSTPSGNRGVWFGSRTIKHLCRNYPKCVENNVSSSTVLELWRHQAVKKVNCRVEYSVVFTAVQKAYKSLNKHQSFIVEHSVARLYRSWGIVWGLRKTVMTGVLLWCYWKRPCNHPNRHNRTMNPPKDVYGNVYVSHKTPHKGQSSRVRLQCWCQHCDKTSRHPRSIGYVLSRKHCQDHVECHAESQLTAIESLMWINCDFAHRIGKICVCLNFSYCKATWHVWRFQNWDYRASCRSRRHWTDSNSNSQVSSCESGGSVQASEI